jgi:hypothetical protein
LPRIDKAIPADILVLIGKKKKRRGSLDRVFVVMALR